MNNSETYLIIKQIKDYAKENGVPIMQDEGIEFMKTFIEKKGIKRILEIGTAIGYSAIMMALVDPEITIVTIERDETRYLEALKNIKKLKLEDRITLLFNDALNVHFDSGKEFDLIFIDAAKGKNQAFFEQFENNLALNGYIVTDNMKFHGLVDKTDEELLEETSNVRGLVRKIRDYTYFLENHMLYKTTIFGQVGDGIAVTERRG